jgi:hypothetical protein
LDTLILNYKKDIEKIDSTINNIRVEKKTINNYYDKKSEDIRSSSTKQFDSLFKSDNTIAPYSKETPNPMDICNTLMFNQNKNVADQRCFRYTLDSQVYTPRKYYAYYKKPILNAENINRLNSIKHPSDYSNNLVTLQSYKELLRIDEADPRKNGALVAAFKKYICTNTPSDRELLTTQINNLKQVYNDFSTNLNEIKMDRLWFSKANINL